nr:hypothetical protein [Chenggangzhangella methanolivorans]
MPASPFRLRVPVVEMFWKPRMNSASLRPPVAVVMIEGSFDSTSLTVRACWSRIVLFV